MMKKYITYLCITAIFVLLSGCAGGPNYCDTNIEHRPKHNVLPFNDGMFILTTSDFEDREAALLFSEESQHRYSRGTHWHANYLTSISHSHAKDFLDIMNSFSPVLVSSVITDITEWPYDEPFEGLTFDNSLYIFFHTNIPNLTFTLEMDGYNTFSIHMRVYQTNECGLLHFHLFGTNPVSGTDDISYIIYHSLYRISLDELGEFIQFAESLERFRIDVHGHEHPLRHLLRQLGVPIRLHTHAIIIVPIIIFISITVTIVLIVRRYRKKKAKISIVQEKTDAI